MGERTRGIETDNAETGVTCWFPDVWKGEGEMWLEIERLYLVGFWLDKSEIKWDLS